MAKKPAAKKFDIFRMEFIEDPHEDREETVFDFFRGFVPKSEAAKIDQNSAERTVQVTGYLDF